MVGQWCPPDTQSDIYAALTLQPQCSGHTQSQSLAQVGFSYLLLLLVTGAFKNVIGWTLDIHSGHQNLWIMNLVQIIQSGHIIFNCGID